MMPYTCIIQKSNGDIHHRLIYGSYGAGWTTEQVLREEEPGSSVLAAIPGNHMTSIWMAENKRDQKHPSSIDVDLWDLDDLN